MEIILLLVVLWIFLRARRNKKQSKPFDQWDAFEQESKRQAGEQRKYDAYMMSLPELAGDGTHSQPVHGSNSYKETLDNFLAWMERYHPNENEINVILEIVDKQNSSERAIRIEAGQAVIGFIHSQDDDKILEELSQLGGKARASARLSRLIDGTNQLSLDVARPLKFTS